MKGLPPKTMPLRVAVQGDATLIDTMSIETDELILSPVETNLEISARVTQAEVLLVDVTANPTKALADIRGLQVKSPVLALVNPGQASAAVDAGAKGAISRTSSPAAIAAALKAVGAGLAVFDGGTGAPTPGATTASVNLPGEHAVSITANRDVLTNREQEVLVLLADGLSNKEIAAKLEISEHTAKFHVNSILQKMNAQKRVEAVVRAAKLGLIEL